jgi:hypothetical protein
MWKVGLPLSPVQLSSHLRFHKLSCSWLLGGAAAPASRHVCLPFMWEVGLPSSPVEFSSLHHSHKLPCSWLLAARGPSLFLHLMWSGDSLHRLQVWKVKVMPFLSDYACKMCLHCLSKISLQEARFRLPPSSLHLGIPTHKILNKCGCSLKNICILIFH